MSQTASSPQANWPGPTTTPPPLPPLPPAPLPPAPVEVPAALEQAAPAQERTVITKTQARRVFIWEARFIKGHTSARARGVSRASVRGRDTERRNHDACV